MRVKSLVILAVIAGAAAYMILLTPQWAIDFYDKATGYGPAATPTEAMDKYLKAVKARKLKIAAKFCTGDYAEQLKRGAPAGQEIGPLIDGISDYMKNKGLATDKCVLYLHLLDPLPTNVKTGAAPKEIDANTAKGYFVWEGLSMMDRNFRDVADFQLFLNTFANEQRQMDGKMFNTVLRPVNLFDPKGFDIVKDGDGWKLKFAAPPPVQVQAIDHYINNYKAYVTRLTVYRRDVTNDRYPGKAEFERELVTALQESK